MSHIVNPWDPCFFNQKIHIKSVHPIRGYAHSQPGKGRVLGGNLPKWYEFHQGQNWYTLGKFTFWIQSHRGFLQMSFLSKRGGSLGSSRYFSAVYHVFFVQPKQHTEANQQVPRNCPSYHLRRSEKSVGFLAGVICFFSRGFFYIMKRNNLTVGRWCIYKYIIAKDSKKWWLEKDCFPFQGGDFSENVQGGVHNVVLLAWTYIFEWSSCQKIHANLGCIKPLQWEISSSNAAHPPTNGRPRGKIIIPRWFRNPRNKNKSKTHSRGPLKLTGFEENILLELWWFLWCPLRVFWGEKRGCSPKQLGAEFLNHQLNHLHSPQKHSHSWATWAMYT